MSAQSCEQSSCWYLAASWVKLRSCSERAGMSGMESMIASASSRETTGRMNTLPPAGAEMVPL